MELNGTVVQEFSLLEVNAHSLLNSPPYLSHIMNKLD